MFEVTARLKPRDGELEAFKYGAAEMMRLARAHDTKTLRYDWFISQDATQCEVREGYVDADGLLEHNAHVREARDRLFHEHAYGHDMTIYGEPSPALAALMERMAGEAAFHRFSLLHGLESDGAARGTSVFEATARLSIREGKLEGFRQYVAELLRQVGELDEKPLRYDWFLSHDGTVCEVREAYANADALLAHQHRIGPAKMQLFRDFVESHTMSFYGELSPALGGALKAMGVTYTAFSFLQGLDADISVHEEVTA